MNTVNCINPDIILNPRANYFAFKYGTIVCGNRTIELNQSLRQFYYYSFPYAKYNPKKLHISKENGDHYYFLDKKTGETEPMYMLVPCNECTICINSKQQSWAKRAIAESQTHPDRPYFFTLTYKDQFLPANGVDKEEIQKFLKRLRRNIDKDGYDNSFRYMIVSEYGADPRYTRRAHYHGIIFGLSIPEEYNHNQILQEQWVKSQIDRAWQREITHAKVVAYCNLRTRKEHNKIVYSYSYEQIGRTDLQKIKKNSGSFYYTFKYTGKPNEHPVGKNDNFFLTSRGNQGGIGSAFIEHYRDYLEQNPTATEIKFREKFTLKEETMPLIKYFRNRIFPSQTIQVPKEFRDSIKRMCYNIQLLKQNIKLDAMEWKNGRIELQSRYWRKYIDKLTKMTHDTVQIPFFNRISYDARRDVQRIYATHDSELIEAQRKDIVEQLREDRKIIHKHRKLNFKKIHQTQINRDISIASAIEHAPVQEDLIMKARKIEIKWDLQKSREKC